jgi:ankyrin repeat protein
MIVLPAQNLILTALMLAAVNGNVEIVRELIAAGANIDTVNNGGYTAFLYASANGHLNIMRELIG